MSIDQAAAELMACNYITSLQFGGLRYVIVESKIREDKDGWYFPYQSEEFIRTGDFDKSLVGNWPIFVSRDGTQVGPPRPGMPIGA